MRPAPQLIGSTVQVRCQIERVLPHRRDCIPGGNAAKPKLMLSQETNAGSRTRVLEDRLSTDEAYMYRKIAKDDAQQERRVRTL